MDGKNPLFSRHGNTKVVTPSRDHAKNRAWIPSCCSSPFSSPASASSGC
jgi:hypothetical protein